MRILNTLLAILVALPLFAQLDPSSPQAWIDSPEAYFVSPDERVTWGMQVRSDESARQFIAQYWKEHGEAVHQEIERRIAFADKTFPLGKTPGSRTEEGRVWIILGSPTTAKNVHTSLNGDISGTPDGRLQNNILEQQAKMTVIWVYNADRLPKDLHLPRLEVRFVQDVSRGFQMIDNPAQVDPVLVRAVALFNEQNTLAASSRESGTVTTSKTTQTTVGGQPAPVAEDPMWGAQDNLGGTIFTGEAYVSPTDEPFYAMSFYLPQAVAAPDALTIDGQVKDESGRVVATIHQPVTPSAYGTSKDRVADASIALPAGKYTAVVALDNGSQHLALTHPSFTVRPSNWTGISKALLTTQVITLDKQTAFEPFTFIATKYLIKGDRRFHESDQITFFSIYSSPTIPDLELKMRVTRNGAPTEASPFSQIPIVQTGPHAYLVGSQFGPKTFTPGHYLLDIDVKDSKTKEVSSTQAEFDVVADAAQ